MTDRVLDPEELDLIAAEFADAVKNLAQAVFPDACTDSVMTILALQAKLSRYKEHYSVLHRVLQVTSDRRGEKLQRFKKQQDEKEENIRRE